MATQSPPRASNDPQVQQHYAAQLALSAALVAQVRALWPSLQPLTAENIARLTDALEVLLRPFSEAAISLATDHYLTMRRDAGITSPVRIPRVELPPRSKIEASVAWATAPLADLEAERDELAAKILERAEAKVQKMLADEARGQMVAAVEGDDKALGFARVARPDACAWCLTLAFRSTSRMPDPDKPGKFLYGDGRHYGVYKSRQTAGATPAGSAEVNRYHTNCHCQVQAIFDSGFTPAQHVLDAQELYSRATEHSKKGELLNDFRRALNAQRGGRKPTLPEVTPSQIVTPDNAEIMRALLDRIGESLNRAA